MKQMASSRVHPLVLRTIGSGKTTSVLWFYEHDNGFHTLCSAWPRAKTGQPTVIRGPGYTKKPTPDQAADEICTFLRALGVKQRADLIVHPDYVEYFA